MGAADLLHRVQAAGFRLDVAGDKLLVTPASKLTDELRSELRAAKPALMALLTTPNTVTNDSAPAEPRPYRLLAVDADAAHAEPWDDAAIVRFVARVSLFLRRGISASDADDLAERLHLRDVQGDGLALCLECQHLAGRAATGWRCGNAQEAGVAQDLSGAVVVSPQRCKGFAE